MNETTSETIPLTRYTHPNASISDSLGPNEHTAIRREEEAEEAEALLAKDDSETEEEDWTVEVDENTIRALHPTCWDLPIFRFSLCGFTVGFLFFAIKLVFMKYTHSTEHHHRVPERMFYNGTESFGSTVIMISLDGFRSEYLSREITPNLQRIASHGMRAEYMHPSFPSSTFPNHWTLATGLYPEAHGIVGNTFYDPVLKEEFMYNKEEVTNKTQWWGGEPIWVTAALQGLRTAVDMWPGSTASVHHVRSNFLVKFNETVSPHEKMDTVLKWIDKPTEERPQLIAVYVPQVDTVGHKNGPVSLEMNSTIIEVDTAIGYLIKGLEDRNIDTHIHVVIMSDHGMTSTGASKRIYYDDILSPTVLSSLREPEASPLLNLRPSTNISSDSLLKSVYHELKNYTQHVANPHFKVYLKEEVPMRYHYRASQRIAPIVAIPDPGYLFSLHEDINRSKQHEVFRTVGSHGYDNLFPDMRAIFLAQGPKILRRYGRGSVIAPFFNTEVYEFITDLLNIPSAPNNGTLGGEFFRVSRG